MSTMIKINGTEIKTPNDMDVEHFNITNSGRVADGSMTMDLVAKKAKLTLKYNVLDGNQISLLSSLVDSTAMFFDVTYPDQWGNWITINCYCGTFKYSKFRSGHLDPINGYYWKDVQIDLIER